MPVQWNSQLLGKTIQPLPGANKNRVLLGIAIRVISLGLFILTLPLSALSVITALPLRAMTHRYRPSISCINNAKSMTAHAKKREDLLLTEASPLMIRTHNIGFVPTTMSILGNLRHPLQRAQDLVQGITQDPLKPDLIFFQEAFHEDATKILCEGIKEEYPYIIHNIAPHLLGFNSGAMVASKYPIDHAEFHRFTNMTGPERISPRGIIKVTITSKEGPIMLYGIHTQAMVGESRAQIRARQIEHTKALMDQDKAITPNAIQILLGDLNTHTITPWGESTIEPEGHAEQQVRDTIDQHFEDLYLRDHDPLTGQRTQGTSFYLETDNARLQETLEEPSGSWYHGLLSHPGTLYALKMKLEQKLYSRPTPKQVRHVVSEPQLWGTPSWYAKQEASTSRFDYILVPQGSSITGHAEIRRPVITKEAHSAPSDHLPVDARIFLR